MSAIPYSVLDLVPVAEGSQPAESFAARWIWPVMPNAWAIAATGWRSTTTCRASPAPPPRC